MHQNRRLPHRIRTKKSQQHFSRMVLFVFVAVMAMVAGGYYFFTKPVAEVAAPLESTREESSLLPPLLDEENEEVIMDDVFADSEMVQLYKIQEGFSSSKYWQWPLKQCAWSGPAIALVVHQEKDLSQEDLQRLETLGIPLTLVIAPDQISYDLASSWAESQRHGLFLSFPLDRVQFLSSKEMGDQLEKLLQGKKILTGVLGSMEGPLNQEALTHFLLHLKHRGLVFLDGSQTERGVLNEISHKTLALSLKTDLKMDNFLSLPPTTNTHPLIVNVSLKATHLSKIISWIKQQKKKGTSFVLATDLFCWGHGQPLVQKKP